MSKGEKPLHEPPSLTPSRSKVRRAKVTKLKQLTPIQPAPTSEAEARLAAQEVTIEALSAQLDSLDQAIEGEEQRVQGTRLVLDPSYREQVRLLHLRRAMLAFVLELETSRK